MYSLFSDFPLKSIKRSALQQIRHAFPVTQEPNLLTSSVYTNFTLQRATVFYTGWTTKSSPCLYRLTRHHITPLRMWRHAAWSRRQLFVTTRHDVNTCHIRRTASGQSAATLATCIRQVVGSNLRQGRLSWQVFRGFRQSRKNMSGQCLQFSHDHFFPFFVHSRFSYW
jgi:hypothetical protein